MPGISSLTAPISPSTEPSASSPSDSPIQVNPPGTTPGTPLAASLYGAIASVAVGAGAMASGASPSAAMTIAGLLAIPMAISATLASAARLSLDEGEALLTPKGTTTLSLSIVGGGTALTVLGALLKATTHHRGLGGVTFAVLGLGALVGVVLASARLATLVTRNEVVASVVEKIAIAKAAVILVALVAIGGLLKPDALDLPMMLASLGLGALLPITSSRGKIIAGVGGALSIALTIAAVSQLGSASDAVKKHGQLAGMFVTSESPAASE